MKLTDSLLYIIIFILILSIVYADNYNNPLTRSIADQIYCLLIGCTITGDVNIGGGYNSGGITLYGTGDNKGSGFFANDILIAGNITSVSDLSINGSLLPSANNIYNVGNGSLRWKNANFTGRIQSGALTIDGSSGADSILQAGTGSGGNSIIFKDDLGTTILNFNRNNGLLLSAGLQWTPGGTYDIGQGQASNDPRNLFLRNYANIGNAIIMLNGSSSIATSWFNGGNVGIGTASPARTLTVQGNANVSGFLEIGDGNYSTIGTIRMPNNGSIVFRNTGNTVDINAIKYESPNHMVVGNGNGYHQLTILGTITNINATGAINAKTDSNFVAWFNSGATSPAGNAFIVKKFTSGTNILTLNDDGLLGINVTPTDTLHVVGTARINGGASGTGLFVDKNSNVGIGTTGPTAKLDIRPTSGTSLVYTNIQNDGSDLYVGMEGAGAEGLINSGLAYAAVISQVNARALQLGTSNTARLTIDSSGNVGIGTTGPGKLLQLNSGAPIVRFSEGGTFRGDIGISDTGSNAIFTGDADNTLGIRGDAGINLGAGNAIHLAITTAGNVGIGTTNPGTILEVYKSGTGTTLGQMSNNIRLNNPQASVVNAGSEISFRGGTSATDNVSVYAVLSAPITDASSDGAYGYLSFSTKAARTTSGLTEAMRITGTGNIGIGTTGPGSKLTVVGTFNASRSTSAGDLYLDSSGNLGIGTTSPGSALDVRAASVLFNLQSTTGTNVAYQSIVNTGGTMIIGLENSAGSGLIAGTSAYDAIINHQGNFAMKFGTNNLVRMTISNAGNVGIGTTSPNFKLDTSGKINSTALITDDASGSIITCNVGEIRGNTTANKICLCTTANNWKCATVS